MNKAETIEALKQRMNGQEFIMMRIKNSIKFHRQEDISDIFQKENEFGELFLNPKNNYRELLGSVLYQGISKYYEAWRELCVKIYNMYIQDLNAKKVKFKKITERDMDIIKAIYDDLETVHKELEKQCETAMARLNALGEDKF